MDARAVTTRQVTDKPPVPIKTYQWEDLKRSRRKGGYPWTYLDKRPFDDSSLDDFAIRTEKHLRKAKSSASINRHAVSRERGSDRGNMEMEENKENIMIESNDSSADVSISQYLDKEEKSSSEDLLEMDELAKMHQERVKGLTIGEEYEYWSKLQKGEIPNVLGSPWPIPNLNLKGSSRASSREVLDAPGPSKGTEGSKSGSQRAKSEEPGRKRKHSIESSYSRVSKYSLSPQGIMRKIKEARDKIKLSKLFTKSESKLNKKAKREEPIIETKKEKKEKTEVVSKKAEAPKYIHIPLKPPPGETDEFSYLEFASKDSTKRDVSPIAEETKEETPETPIGDGSGVQLIILTAPSDDEILSTPAVPETPSEATDGYFEQKSMDELKKLATDAVDKYSPETKRKVFSASEEEDKDELSTKPLSKSNENIQAIKEEPAVKEKPPVPPSVETGTKKKKKKVIKKDKSKETTKDDEQLLETQKTDDDKLQEQIGQGNVVLETKLTIDEEDGLKTAAVIEDETKAKEPVEGSKKTEQSVKESPLLKKKVSFKRRSKEDTDGIYEDVLVSSELVPETEETLSRIPLSPPLTPKQLHDERIAKMHQEKIKGMTIAEEYEYWSKVQKGELPNEPEDEPPLIPATPSPTVSTPHVIDEQIVKMHEARIRGMTPAEEYAYWKKVQSGELPFEIPADRGPSETLQVDEASLRIHLENVKGMSVAEEQEYWSRVNAHDYEPVIPPDDGHFRPIESPKPSTPITDSDIEYLAAKAADIELRTTGIMAISNKEEPSEALFVPLESALKDETKSTKSDGKAEEGHGKKLQEALQKQATNLKRQASIVSKKATEQAEKIQTRVKSIKRPNIKMPPKPKFEKTHLPKLKIERLHMPHFKIEKPKMPNVKLPEKMKNISLSLPRRKKSSVQQPTSTESTAGDSEKRTVFDFSTYPKIFRRKKRVDDGIEIHTPRTGTDVTPDSERTTLPRFKFTSRWKGKFTKQSPPSATNDTINSLKSKDSEGSENRGLEDLRSRSMEEREDSVERRMRLAASSRYDDDVEMDDAYMKENQEIHRASSLNDKFNDRWNHGTFHNENASEEQMQPASLLKKKIENIHSGSSNDLHRHGVLEEINSDEFFLRQKGISQDNIEVGAYLSSEIREAFRTPSNALLQLETAQPEAPKRRPFKKPKRKKTPHVSQEGIQYDQESIHTEPDESLYQTDFDTMDKPERPKRRGRKREEDVDMQYMEDQDQSEMKNFEESPIGNGVQANIILSNLYHVEHFLPDNSDIPAAPPRKHKSMRSLNATSEHDSITEELNGFKVVQQEVNQYEHEYQIPTPDQPPKRPFRTRSRTRSRSRGTTLPEAEVLSSNSQHSLTYKSQIGDSPVPPCRTRSIKSEGSERERFFFTTPRSSAHVEPVRPLRNYSTLGPSRPPRRRSVPNLTDEEKHIGDPYIEIEEEDHSKDLQSGAILLKMKGRPLPAPPRPPRKVRDVSTGRRRNAKSMERETRDVETSVQTEPLPDDFECEALVYDPNDRVITPTIDKYAEIRKPKARREFEHLETITHGSLVVQPFAHGEEIPATPVEMFSRDTERIVTVKREKGPELDYDETSEIPEHFTKLQSPPVQQVVERIIEKHIPIQLEPANEVETLKAHKLQVADLDVDRLAVNELHASKIKVGDIESTAINVDAINSNSGNLVVSGIELPASFFQQLVETLHEQAEHVAAARLSPAIHAHVKTIETKESQTNTDAYQESILHLQAQSSAPIRKPTSRKDVGKPEDRLRSSEQSPTSQPTEYTLRERVEQEIDEVILSAEQAVLERELEGDAKFGQKKTPFEVHLVEIESATPPERPPRAVSNDSDLSPPPRPPSPPLPSVFTLRSAFKDLDIDDDIPLAPRRRRQHHHHHHHHHHKPPPSPGSSSEDVVFSRRRYRSPEPSIPQLTGQLTRACYNAAERSLKRLIWQTTEYVMDRVDGKHEVNVAVVILIVFIALLFLIYWNSDGKQIHHHHWEYFNPPRDI